MTDEDLPTSNEVILATGRHLRMGNDSFEIIDRSDGVRYVDLFTEATYMNGVVYLSMGSAIYEFGNPPVVEVSTRVRMSMVAVQNLYAMLGNIISDAHKPPDQSKAN
ncbi:hypothetical protein ACCT14_29000 [Rhizobium brockwellii]|jgi:hypothetical protein|uniref:hypothetical protein n=1 Tax=Rhizobium TaxID=379 RepID=UPI00103113F1|nr:hypothetical protein [Rhizobium leguminosarum]TAV72676.1 hypothetical protein ELI28_03730 [Rhizobium leguminosarum]TAV77276.1 hypothetical protein ELI27_03730 [Rhizobium leguminosarum]TAZ29022.1 hypothetical protein ELH73_03740 [Rhizobium leguminosarum]